MTSTAIRRLRVREQHPGPQEALVETLSQHGLPLVVRPRHRLRHLVPYTGPLLLVLGVLLMVQAVTARIMEVAIARSGVNFWETEELPDGLLLVATTTTVSLIAAYVLSPLMLWAITALATRGSSKRRLAISAVGMIMILAAALTSTWPSGLLLNILSSLATVVVVLVGAYFGLGVITLWALQRILQELTSIGAMIIRALPLLMLVLLFLFYDSNIWQIAVGISWLNVTLTAAVLAILANVLNLVVTADIIGDSHLRDHLRESRTRARLTERANIIAVPSLVVTIQAGLFSVLVFTFLVAFGMLSIPVSTIKKWVGQDPNIVFPWLMPGLPLSQELLKVCLVLAAFAGLNFVASLATDQRHRTLFMAGVLTDLDRGLKVREQYLR